MGPCDWNPTYVNCGEDNSCLHIDALDPVAAAAVMEAGVYWLWEASHRRFGNCPVTIRPCLRGCETGRMWRPYRSTSGWVNVGCGSCGDRCSCSHFSEVLLPTIGEVLAVESHGVSLPPGSWRVDNMRRLVRVDGGVWPRCQDVTADPPTWAVTYIPGLPVPEMGRLVAGTLICQLARRFCGEKCDLPPNTTQVTRQGISITLTPGDNTGLWQVDQWLGLVNRPMARVHSPDLAVTRVVETSGS